MIDLRNRVLLPILLAACLACGGRTSSPRPPADTGASAGDAVSAGDVESVADVARTPDHGIAADGEGPADTTTPDAAADGTEPSDAERADVGPPDTEPPDAAPPDSGAEPPADPGPPTDPGQPDPGQPDTSSAGCGFPADHARHVVISHPFTATGGKGVAYELLALNEDGTLAQTGTTFDMGRAGGGIVRFTSDGRLGMVAQDDGSLGVLRLDPDGSVTVLHPALTGDYYAGDVAFAPAGDRVWVVDGNWAENGGGLYSLMLACDGSLDDEGKQAASKLADAMAFVPGAGSRAVVPAKLFMGSPPGHDAHLVETEEGPALLAGADLFPDDEQIVSSLGLSADGSYALVGDNSMFSAEPNRVAVAKLGKSAMSAVQVLAEVEDPMAIVVSPYGDAALVSSGFANAVIVLGLDPGDPESPFVVVGQPSYAGKKPQLPGGAVGTKVGAVDGMVYLAENLGVRRLRFEEGGTVTDLGLHPVGAGSAAIVGAIGVQP